MTSKSTLEKEERHDGDVWVEWLGIRLGKLMPQDSWSYVSDMLQRTSASHKQEIWGLKDKINYQLSHRKSLIEQWLDLGDFAS